jgi:hypothetical protein
MNYFADMNYFAELTDVAAMQPRVLPDTILNRSALEIGFVEGTVKEPASRSSK